MLRQVCRCGPQRHPDVSSQTETSRYVSSSDNSNRETTDHTHSLHLTCRHQQHRSHYSPTDRHQHHSSPAGLLTTLPSYPHHTNHQSDILLSTTHISQSSHPQPTAAQNNFEVTFDEICPPGEHHLCAYLRKRAIGAIKTLGTRPPTLPSPVPAASANNYHNYQQQQMIEALMMQQHQQQALAAASYVESDLGFHSAMHSSGGIAHLMATARAHEERFSY
ncbi:hypothetical protein PGTUg99_003362 [Puccinia graminis f. sp. tritici]|uniref:Uncharacterized protein n=1 Tax=Puccinia graminis f. sp. tritici TaxID=56615 RepID=A0A5B0RV78_PUCGR|nr:hypothetical protein PGTUg99_003362 [Puccinia graminis f. sp. tritici]